jgi:hypothetical protein
MNPVAATDAAIRACAADRHYAAATVARWLRLAPPDRAALLDLVHDLRPSEHQLRDLWDWAEEIAQRDATSIAAVLAVPAVTGARARSLGRNDRLRSLKAALRRVRYPQLSAAEDRLCTLVRALALPPSVRVVPPEHLEGDALRIEIVARNAATLRSAVAHLAAVMHTAACEELFALLAEPAEP